ASLMAAEHMADNAKTLETRLGRAAGTVDLYLAHFLGAGGAARFLERLASSPETAASTLLPAAASANKSVFFARGQPRTLQQVYDLFATKLGSIPAAPSARPADRVYTPASSTASLAGRTDGYAPGSLVAALIADGTGASAVQGAARTGAGLYPAQAARLAYLLLADLGG
ncbi:MAG: lytic transglycosylase domain-containing protein, partial [Sandaracinobacteroides sp.]